MESDNAIYEKNKNVNKEKIQFYNFLTYCTKSEISIQEVQLIFYWIGIIECFTFFLSFCLFCSYPKQFWRNWFFIFHVARAFVGFIILKRLPRTSEIISKLENYENLPVSEIQLNLYKSYSKLLSVDSDQIKPLFIIYWLITVVNILLDIIIFFVFLHEWGNRDFNFRNSMTLIVISILFSKIIFIIFFIFLVCNFFFLDWFLALKNHFTPDIVSSINNSVFGEIKNLRNTLGFNKVEPEQQVEIKANQNNV